MSSDLSLPSAPASFRFNTPVLLRVLDIIVSGTLILALFPLLLPVVLAIKWACKGPVLKREQRIGRGGYPFTRYLIRCDHASEDGSRTSGTHDTRQRTVLDNFLQRTHLHRAPQLFNVLRGEMSLVGPEPETDERLALCTTDQRRILTVRPGLVSPGQLYVWDRIIDEDEAKGDAGDAERSFRAKVALDLAYLQSRTLWSDLTLLAIAITKVLVSNRNAKRFLTLRNRHFFFLDIAVLSLIPTVTLTMLEDGLSWWPDKLPALLLFTVVALFVTTTILYNLGLYRRYWPYASVNELTLLLVAVALSTGVLTVTFTAVHPVLVDWNLALYRAFPFFDGLLSGLVIGGSRFGMRGFYYWHRRQQLRFGGQRVLVVGAGEAGVLTVKEMQTNSSLKMTPVAFVDDDPGKAGIRIQGVPVLGTTNDIPHLVQQQAVERIIVAIPSALPRRQREIIAICQATGAVIDRVPGMYELLAGHKTVSYRPRVNINHFLHRTPVETDQSGLYDILRGATTLVTGAGGSIGSELCRQIAQFGPKMIILLGHGENSIFETMLDLNLSYPQVSTCPIIVDIRDQERLRWAVDRYRPDLIFHAAAHKHVPFMEASVDEAITNNVLGTRNVLRAAEEAGVERLVLISTDKAINPVNVMGATKRIAELLVIAAAQRSGRAYMAVRFGNVLGSRGSVLRVFQQQIAGGGPVTVTHPEMYRYFMSIPEAVQLVLQAAMMGQGGEMFVLDMGEQIRIEDLATELIRLYGFVPGRDIEIVYTGIRPGEKLREELFMESENFQRTTNPKVFVTKSRESVDDRVLEQEVTTLITLARERETQATVEQMFAIIPEYHPLDQPARVVHAGS